MASEDDRRRATATPASWLVARLAVAQQLTPSSASAARAEAPPSVAIGAEFSSPSSGVAESGVGVGDAGASQHMASKKDRRTKESQGNWGGPNGKEFRGGRK